MRVYGRGSLIRAATTVLVLCLVGVLGTAATAADKPKIYVIATGGTIASTGAGQAHLTGEELVRNLPGVEAVAQLSVEQFSNIGSEYMTPERWKALALRVNELLQQRPDLDGIVVTHGTDTLEEGSYFLDLTVGGSRPVVFTAAMRNSRAISPDGPGNLLNAIRVAASNSSRRRGTLVVMNDQIFAAREVTKHKPLGVDAFVSPDAGPVGSIDVGEVHFHRAPTRAENEPAAFPLTADVVFPMVGIVASYAGADEMPIRSFVNAGAKGIVVSALAGWSVSSAQEEAIAEAARKGVIVVMSSRTGSGRIVLDDRVKWKTVLDEALPVIGAGTLNPQKARILLMLALTRIHDPAKLAALFDK